MKNRSGRSLLLFAMVFAFACLLLSGGWRLVACEVSDDPVPVKSFSAIRTALSVPQMQTEKSMAEMRRSTCAQRLPVTPAEDIQPLKHTVQSDANGNVIAAGTYMRAVYQAFVLDDGFV